MKFARISVCCVQVLGFEYRCFMIGWLHNLICDQIFTGFVMLIFHRFLWIVAFLTWLSLQKTKPLWIGQKLIYAVNPSWKHLYLAKNDTAGIKFGKTWLRLNVSTNSTSSSNIGLRHTKVKGERGGVCVLIGVNQYQSLMHTLYIKSQPGFDKSHDHSVNLRQTGLLSSVESP